MLYYSNTPTNRLEDPARVWKAGRVKGALPSTHGLDPTPQTHWLATDSFPVVDAVC